MKKRILSFLLVAAMMLPMVIMPASATGWKFADEFEKLDARNIGQYQIDVGAAESTGVVIDGKVDGNDNYTATQIFNYGYVTTGQYVAPTNALRPDITLKMARKGSTLYAAFIVPETEAESQTGKFQLGMGVSEGPTFSHAVKRVNMFLNANSTFSWNGVTYYGGTTGKDEANNPYIGTSYIESYKKAWVADATSPDGGYSTYEVEMSIDDLALILSSTKTSAPHTSIRMLQIMFFYYADGKSAECYYFSPGAAWNNANNKYARLYTVDTFLAALKKAQTPEHTYGSSGTVIGHPIAFGGADVAIKDWSKQDALGAVGEDVRYVHADQLIDIKTEAEVAPVIDGVISEGEYTVLNKTLEHAKAGYGESAVKANFAYKDGYLYLAMTTADTDIRQTQLDMNVMPYSNYADTVISRLSCGVKVDGVTVSGASKTPTRENTANGWMSADSFGAMANYTASSFKYIVEAKAKMNGGVAVYEYKISLANLAEYWENMYPVSDGYTYFGLQFWSAGNDGKWGGNDDQYGFRNSTSVATLKSLDVAAWGLEWMLYTISIPETIDDYKPEHMLKHFYNDVDFKTADAGSARITASMVNSGLRFKTTFDAQFIADLKAVAGEDFVVGTLIAPADYVANAGVFTKAALEAKYGNKGYIDVVADIDTPYATDADGNVTIAGSITNIKEGNLARDFSAVAYVQFGDTIIYSTSVATRNISEIADAAVKDVKTEATEGYENKIADGVYSPYTLAQYELLQQMIVAAQK